MLKLSATDRSNQRGKSRNNQLRTHRSLIRGTRAVTGTIQMSSKRRAGKERLAWISREK